MLGGLLLVNQLLRSPYKLERLWVDAQLQRADFEVMIYEEDQWDLAVYTNRSQLSLENEAEPTPGDNAELAPIMLLHDLGSDSHSWYPLLEQSAFENHPIYMVDFYGHGRSRVYVDPEAVQAISLDLRPEGLAESVLTAVQEVQQPMVIIGHGLGAWVGSIFAAKYPDRVAQLIGINPAGVDHVIEPSSFFPKSLEEMTAYQSLTLPSGAFQLTSVYLDDRLEHALRIEKDNGGVVHQMIEDLTVSLPLTTSTLPTTSSSFLWGTPDSIYPIDSYGKRFQSVFARAKHTLLDGCGHAPQLECSELVATELGRMISK